MRLLLIHQNFPGQFRQLCPFLLDRGDELVVICSHGRPLPEHPRLRALRYAEPSNQPVQGLPQGSRLWHEALERAQEVGRLCAGLAAEGWRPDRILAHCGWGETLGLREIWQEVPQLLWPELWLRPEHAGLPADAWSDPATLPYRLKQLGRNALTRAALSQAQGWVLPTAHQAASFPPDLQGPRLHVVHEGIDVSLACPNPAVRFEVRGIAIDRSVPTITFVNRNLERLRGFDAFMRALPAIQRGHPTVRVLIVGDNEGGYGGGHPSGRPLREVMLQELAGQLDRERIHFLGRVPHPVLIAMLQASWVHVYLSQPFVLGWSLLEAMACGCCVVGSRGMPVAEVIRDGVDGLLVPIEDPERLARRVLTLLADQRLRCEFGARARQAALAWDQTHTLPRLAQLVEGLEG